MTAETQSFQKLLDQVRKKAVDVQTHRLLDELEEDYWRTEGDFEQKTKSMRDEITVLRGMAGVPGDDLKTWWIAQEKEFLRLKRESEDQRIKIKSLLEKNLDTAQDNERLEREMERLSRQAAQAKSQWDVSEQVLAREKKVFTDEMQKAEAENQRLAGELSAAKQALEKNLERSLSEGRSLEEMQARLFEQRRQVLNADCDLFQGLYTFLENRVGGVVGSSLMMAERTGSIKGRIEEWIPFWRFLLKVPSWLIKREEPLKNISEDLGALNDVMKQNADNAKELQGGLNAFAPFTKPSQTHSEKILISELIDAYVKEKERVFKAAKILVQKSFGDVHTVVADPVMLRSALDEVVMNAVEAQPDGGEIVLKVWQDASVELAMISVKDLGPGVPGQVSDKVFQPFFTTKQNHLGLGLTRASRWMVYNNGAVEMAQPSAGAEFVIKIPLTARFGTGQ